MFRKLLYTILLLPLLFSTLPAEIIYEERFDSAADGTVLEKLGWTIKSSPEKSSYFIKDGKLRVECFPSPGLQGGYAEIDIPLCRKGVLEFDLNSDSDSSKPGTCLVMDLYNISIFWHDYCKDWRRYFPEPVSKRMKYFHVEPVGHRRISEVVKNKWSHYKIYFDMDKDRVEYYKDNMDDPAFIDGNVPIWGRSEYLGGKLRLGNWGIAAGKVSFLVDNIKLTSLDKESESNSAKTPRDRILLFNGLSFERYNIKQILSKNGVPGNVIKEFNILNPRPALTPKNNFQSDILPSAQTTMSTKCFVMIDYPFGPGEVVPDCVVKDIIENVKEGARLVIFGGLFSLGKGEYGQSILAEYLPVKINTQWDIGKCEKPLPLHTAAPGKFTGLEEDAAPFVFYMHNLEITKDANVLLKAGERPLLVSRKVGDGEILVFLGTSCGLREKGFMPFWEWPGWSKLATQIITE